MADCAVADLNKRVERPRELLARLDQRLRPTRRMVDQAGSAPRRRRVESHVGFPPRRVPHSNGPGVQTIVSGDRMHEPATGTKSAQINKRQARDIPKPGSPVVHHTFKHHLLSMLLVVRAHPLAQLL